MEDLEKKKYWVWLAIIPNLGIKRKRRLLEIYKNPKRIFELSKEELIKVDGIGENIIENIMSSKKERKIERELIKMYEKNINIISINDKDYPEILKNIYDPPVSIFVKGNVENLKKNSLAIIGCRQATDYGKKAAKYFGYQLSKNRWNIVSGLAKGVDSYSHVGNICAKIKENGKDVDNSSTVGKPIAVVGSGLDIIYPTENKKLEKEILDVGGTIVSEYPLGTKPNKYNFPARNRIISGLSKGILVIEAKKKSGTLITVDFALEQGREVFVVPRKYKFNKFNWNK